MSTTLHPATPDMTRDEAAEILEKNKIHHAVVNNIEGKFAGLYSSWDIARECALDAKVRTHSTTPKHAKLRHTRRHTAGASLVCFSLPRPLSHSPVDDMDRWFSLFFGRYIEWRRCAGTCTNINDHVCVLYTSTALCCCVVVVLTGIICHRRFRIIVTCSGTRGCCDLRMNHK